MTRRPGPVGALAALVAAFAPVGSACARETAAHPLSTWTALVVAGDWRAGEGKSTRAFDNGRRDVAAALVRIGFSPQNVLQHSLRPAWPGDDARTVTDARTAVANFMARTQTASGGCLVFVTSHGLPKGANFGPDVLLTPAMLKQLVADACPKRPAVVVVSACYSGVFAPALEGHDRLVLTAARKDRTSFGCGAEDEHTYFDRCFIDALAKAPRFTALVEPVRACVAAREKAEGMKPPSQPQARVGEAFPLIEPAFAAPPPA